MGVLTEGRARNDNSIVIHVSGCIFNEEELKALSVIIGRWKNVPVYVYNDTDKKDNRN